MVPNNFSSPLAADAARKPSGSPLAADVARKLPSGSLRLPFGMLRLVLDDLARQLADAQPVSETEVWTMSKLSAEMQRLTASASDAAVKLNLGDRAQACLKNNVALAAEIPKTKPNECSLAIDAVAEADNNVAMAAKIPNTKPNACSLAIDAVAEPEGATKETKQVLIQAIAMVSHAGHRNSNSEELTDLQDWQKRLVDIFAMLDQDDSGTLTTDELRKALVTLGVPQARVGKLTLLADADRSGEIDFAEWVRAVRNPVLAQELHAVSGRLSVHLKDCTTGLLTAEAIPHYRCMLQPNSRTRMYWDMLVACLCAYIAVVLPFVYGWEADLGQAADRFKRIDIVINFFFLIDICLNFRTGYFNIDGVVVMDWRSVSKHYLCTWFLLDFVSSVSFEDFGMTVGTFGNMQAAKLLKLGKLGRVAKMLTDATDIANRVEDNMDNKFLQAALRRGSVLVKMLLLCHWLACGLKLVDTGSLKGYQDVSLTVAREYLAAIYWSMTTLTTVGYGDIIPTSDLERIYSSFAMVIGGGFYGYVVGCITSMVQSSDLNSSAYYDRMDLIYAWLDHHKLPREKKRRVRQYFKAYLKDKSALSEAEIWADLSPEMQKELGEYLVNENVRCNPLFDSIPLSSVVRMQSILFRVAMCEGSSVTTAGDTGSAMYMITSGKVIFAAEREDKTTHLTTHYEITLGPGESFGEEVLLGIKEKYEYSTIVLENAKFEVLWQEEFLKTFSPMPAVLQQIRQNAFELHPDWEQPAKPELPSQNADLPKHNQVHLDMLPDLPSRSQVSPSMPRRPFVNL